MTDPAKSTSSTTAGCIVLAGIALIPLYIVFVVACVAAIRWLI